MSDSVEATPQSLAASDQKRADRRRLHEMLAFLQRMSAFAFAAVVVAGIAAAVLFFLTIQKISAKQNELAANAAISTSAVADMQSDLKQLTDLSRDDCQTVDQIRDWLGAIPPADRARLKAPDKPLNLIQQTCVEGEGRYAQLGAFYAAYGPAVIARQNGAYKDALDAYSRTVVAAASDDALKARALEGIAYSQLKTDGFAAARKTIAAAAALKTDYVFTWNTRLKIACQDKMSKADVRRLYADAYAERQRYIVQNAGNAVAEAVSRSDLKLLTDDPELKAVCRYARIP